MSILYTVVICSEELPIASLTVQQLSRLPFVGLRRDVIIYCDYAILRK